MLTWLPPPLNVIIIFLLSNNHLVGNQQEVALSESKTEDELTPQSYIYKAYCDMDTRAIWWKGDIVGI